LSRLDNYLVKNGFTDSRNKAQTLIKDGLVSVDKKVILKSSFKLLGDSIVEVAKHDNYVSRAAYKLKYFLEEINLDIKGKRALDIGSSTGGFTQVLLQNDISEVTAVDVGKGQLHKSIKEDIRVHSYESCDIREFKTKEPFELIVSDVSFISLLNILSEIDSLACGDIILLFKPQFEVGKDAKRDGNGVVLDEKIIQKAMLRFEAACRDKGWSLKVKSPSKITGKEGNLEYCYYFSKR
jgi:23S rRNA (cytidine1920-2'-O)/16S rRNA (cytidine1409-2'-O)-methyltransferase